MTAVPRGTVLLLDLAPIVGHEQHGVRPCIVVSDEATAPWQRFPVLAIVPVTGTAPATASPLYPVFAPERGNGFTKASTALIDHLRSVDPRRVRARLGRLGAGDLARVDKALRQFLALP